MFWKKKELPYSKEVHNDVDYYVVEKKDLAEITKAKIKYSGVVTAKPVVWYYGTSLPWDIESSVEEDHGHKTRIKIDDIPVSIRGIVIPKLGDTVSLLGTWNNGAIEAWRLETPDCIFIS